MVRVSVLVDITAHKHQSSTGTKMNSENILSGPEDLYPPPDVSLGKFITQLLPLHEDKIAQINAETGETRTFQEILTRSLSVAGCLRARGVEVGDVVGVCSENSLDFFLPVLAAFYVGAACAPLNPAYTVRELHHAINLSKPRIIFCSEKALDKMDKVSQELNFVKEIVVFGKGLSHKHVPFSRFVQDRSCSFEPVDGDPNELVATIMCSSGTTGLPKGVVITHKNLLTFLSFITDPRFFNRDIEEEPITIAFLPFFHAMAFVAHLTQLIFGVKSIVMKKFDEELLLRCIQDYKVTVLNVVPPVAIFLAKAAVVGKYDLSSLKIIGCGAAPLSKDIELQIMKRFKLERIGQGYGMTETTLGVLFTPREGGKVGSVGKLIPGTLCKVVDVETGKNLGPNKPGELCFKGPLIMKGYCGDPQATAAIIDHDGFLHTGDIGYYDEDGFFFIVDRMKELIKYKGYQVPPAELEALLLTHPLVKDAGVTGVPDEKAGELPLAFVVKQPGANVTKEEIVKYVEAQVSPQKRLRGGVIFIESIPRTLSGKILRRELRNLRKSNL